MANDTDAPVNFPQQAEIGQVVDSIRGVEAFENGNDKDTSHGRHYSHDNYYYGQKWQCVEFVKRYYFQALSHRMPNAWGHAQDFFDPKVKHGKVNPQRDLLQFENGGDAKPKVDDILVFSDIRFGHLAIITEVRGCAVEVIQQNIIAMPRQLFDLKRKGNTYHVTSPRIPSGWLRKDATHTSSCLIEYS